MHTSLYFIIKLYRTIEHMNFNSCSFHKEKLKMENIEGRLSQPLMKRLNSCGANESLPIIISYDVPFSVNQKSSLLQAIEYNGYNSLRCIQGIACSMNQRQLLNALKNDHVISAEYDSTLYCCLNSARYWSGVDMAVRDFRLTGCIPSSLKNGTGESIVVAVVDTGVDCNHVDLLGKVIGWKNLMGSERIPYDKNGHGTHSAGIIAGSGTANQLYRGVAPGASIVGIKALDDKGNGKISNLVAAMDWIMENQERFNIRIVNLSLSTDEPSDGNDAGCRAVDKAVENELVVCTASGNSGPDVNTIGSPAASKRAITVGAMADMGERGIYLADFSGRGPTLDGRIKPDITAPGVNISAPCSGSLFGYTRLTGTSSAAPFVAGVAALMLEADPSLTPEQIKNILVSTCSHWGGPYSPNIDYGYGLINAYNAVSRCTDGRIYNLPSRPWIFSSIPAQMDERRLYNLNPPHNSYSTLWNPAELCEIDHTSKAANYHIYNSRFPSFDEGSCTPRHFNGRGYIAETGLKDVWYFCVENTTYPVAITFIITNWEPSKTNLDLYLYSPSGREISKSESNTRQESIALYPNERGLYRLEVVSKSGSCSYCFDLSLAGSGLYKHQ